MLGITPFGLFHTLISLVSLFTGLYALLRFGRILDRQHSGQVYIWGTVGSCVTGFFIVRHGGFSQAGKPEADCLDACLHADRVLPLHSRVQRNPGAGAGGQSMDQWTGRSEAACLGQCHFPGVPGGDGRAGDQDKARCGASLACRLTAQDARNRFVRTRGSR